MAWEDGQRTTSAQVSIPLTPDTLFVFPYIALEGLQHCSHSGSAMVTWWVLGMSCFRLTHP